MSIYGKDSVLKESLWEEFTHKGETLQVIVDFNLQKLTNFSKSNQWRKADSNGIFRMVNFIFRRKEPATVTPRCGRKVALMSSWRTFNLQAWSGKVSKTGADKAETLWICKKTGVHSCSITNPQCLHTNILYTQIFYTHTWSCIEHSDKTLNLQWTVGQLYAQDNINISTIT